MSFYDKNGYVMVRQPDIRQQIQDYVRSIDL